MFMKQGRGQREFRIRYRMLGYVMEKKARRSLSLHGADGPVGHSNSRMLLAKIMSCSNVNWLSPSCSRLSS